MGEKGNIGDAASGVAVGATSLIERVTTTATQTVVGAGGDLLETIKDKSIGAVADNTVEAARERLRRPRADDEPPADGTQPNEPA